MLKALQIHVVETINWLHISERIGFILIPFQMRAKFGADIK